MSPAGPSETWPVYHHGAGIIRLLRFLTFLLGHLVPVASLPPRAASRAHFLLFGFCARPERSHTRPPEFGPRVAPLPRSKMSRKESAAPRLPEAVGRGGSGTLRACAFALRPNATSSKPAAPATPVAAGFLTRSLGGGARAVARAPSEACADHPWLMALANRAGSASTA